MTEIETDVPLPDSKKRVNGRARRAASTKPKLNAAAGFLSAVKFVALAQKDMGLPYQTHCLINNGWIVAYDGVLTIGAKIEENVSACPHTHRLMAALSKCGELLSITQLNEQTLVIKSGAFKANVKCIAYGDMPLSFPDDRLGDISNDIKEALITLGCLVHESAQKAEYSGAWFTENSIVSTNGFALIEFWHGMKFPFRVIVPKVTLTCLSKVDKKMTGIGFCDTSITFYFEDESFIKTQLIVDTVPAHEQIFKQHEAAEAYVSPPEDFMNGLNAVESFCDAKRVYFVGNLITSSLSEDEGADFEMKAAICKDDCGFNIEWTKLLFPLMEKINVFHDRLYFFKGSYRGGIMGLKMAVQNDTVHDENIKDSAFANENDRIEDDDIPF